MSALRNALLLLLATTQMVAGLRVAVRLMRTARGARIQHSSSPVPGQLLTVVVPVLDERWRVVPCLDGLMAQPAEVQEILVVDGGSRDGTQALVRAAAERDARIRLLDAAPVPMDWNGKAHGLQMGLRHAHPTSVWILTIDADVRPQPDLARSLLAHVQHTDVALQGLATRQVVSDAADGLLHPALLTTLVYRHGIPGHDTGNVHDAQANGQCSLFRREPLERLGGFAVARDSRCEDVTMARALVEAGHRVGFHEAGDLVETAMYDDWRETWQNWPRSLTLRDRFWGFNGWLRLAEVTLAQGLPLAVLTSIWLLQGKYANRLPRRGRARLRLNAVQNRAHAKPRVSQDLAARTWSDSHTCLNAREARRSQARDLGPGGQQAKKGVLDPPAPLLTWGSAGARSFACERSSFFAATTLAGQLLRVVNIALLAMRVGVLAGTRRAYVQPPPTYWLSPLVDLPVSLRLWQSALQQMHTWRGRALVPEDVWSVT